MELAPSFALPDWPGPLALPWDEKLIFDELCCEAKMFYTLLM